jgi:hypothetical protein
MAVRTPVILWTLRLSMMTTSPGFRVGTRTCAMVPVVWTGSGKNKLRLVAG